MNIAYLVSVFTSFLFLSPSHEDPRMLVAQFSLYAEPNLFKDGEYSLDWAAQFDRNLYANDCDALYDLMTFQNEICSYQELERIKKVIESYKQKQDTTNYNRL